MTMRRCLLVLILTLGLVPPSAVAGDRAKVTTDRNAYRLKEHVRIVLRNDSEETLSFKNPWIVRDRNGDKVAQMFWDEDELRLSPGDKRVWDWNQDGQQFGSDGSSTDIGGVWAQPGRHRVEVKTSAGTLAAGFRIGAFFSLRFDGHEGDQFEIFVARRKAIRQLRNDLDRPRTRRRIVSSLVRGERVYNPDWSYTMDPDEVVLGDAFIEVCDASPDYVEENKSDWMGERWCPWSSYVHRERR